MIPPRAGQPVLATGEVPERASAAMLLLHGRGATARDILTLIPALEAPGWAFLAPQAENGAWYPLPFTAPVERNEPWLSAALDVIAGLLGRLREAGLPPERTVLLGFSQGACLTLEYAARNARRYGGVVGLSGGVIGPDGAPRQDAGSLAGTPVFLGCSEQDPHIPAHRVHHAAEVLRGLGADVTARLYPDLGHSVNEDELAQVRGIMGRLTAVAGPRRTPTADERSEDGVMSTISQPVNTMSYEAKPLILDVVRTERQAFYDLIDDPANWEVQTRCSEWQVRDVVGHMIDVTEGYLARWDMARKGETAPEPLGLAAMAKLLNEHAQAFRAHPRDEVIARLKAGSSTLFSIFEALTEDEWSNFLVPHPYMGPLPTFFYPAFQVIDYGVHTWDIRYGLGEKLRKLDERTAGVLIPYMFVLFQYTVDATSAQGLDTVYGLEVSSEWGGRWRVTVKDGQWSAQPEEGDFAGCEAVFSFDPSDFVLTAYQRFPGGCARGDEQVIDRVRGLFFAI